MTSLYTRHESFRLFVIFADQTNTMCLCVCVIHINTSLGEVSLRTTKICPAITIISDGLLIRLPARNCRFHTSIEFHWHTQNKSHLQQIPVYLVIYVIFFIEALYGQFPWWNIENQWNALAILNLSKKTTLLDSPSDPLLEADTRTVQAGPRSFPFCCQMCTKRWETVVHITETR